MLPQFQFAYQIPNHASLHTNLPNLSPSIKFDANTQCSLFLLRFDNFVFFYFSILIQSHHWFVLPYLWLSLWYKLFDPFKYGWAKWSKFCTRGQSGALLGEVGGGEKSSTTLITSEAILIHLSSTTKIVSDNQFPLQFLIQFLVHLCSAFELTTLI